MLLTKADKILITFLCLFALLIAIPKLAFTSDNSGSLVFVNQGEQVLLKKDIKDEGIYKIRTNYGGCLVEIKNQKVRIKESDCPRKICQSMGWISHSHQLIYCAPNNVYVQINSTDMNEIDSILR